MISLSLDNRALIEFRITVYNKSITDLVANLQFQHWTVESSLTLDLSKEFSAVMNMKEINVMGTLGTTKRVYNMTTRMATKYTLKCLWLHLFKTIIKRNVQWPIYPWGKFVFWLPSEKRPWRTLHQWQLAPLPHPQDSQFWQK